MYAGPTHNPNLFCRTAIYGCRALHPLTVKRRPTVNKTELLNKLSRDSEERLLLARTLDRLELARTRNIPACTGFLSPQERASVGKPAERLRPSGPPVLRRVRGGRAHGVRLPPRLAGGGGLGRRPGQLPRAGHPLHLERGQAEPPGLPGRHPGPGPGSGEGGRSAGGGRRVRHPGAGGDHRLFCFSTWSRRAVQNSRPPPCPWTGWSPRR